MRKVIIITVLSLILAVPLAYGARRGYQFWKQKHFLSLASDSMAKGERSKAVLALRQVLRANNRNAEAYRLMAQIAESERSSEAVRLRSRVVELNPRSSEDRFALARTGLLFKDINAAASALKDVDEAGKQTAGYHNLAGAVESAANRFDKAEAHFLEAVRLDPTNAAVRLNLAVLRLAGTNTATQAEARASLQQLRADPRYSPEALRQLIADAIRQNQTNAALSLSKDLLSLTNGATSDRILRLEALRAARSPELKSTLAVFQQEAARAPQEQGPAMIHELAAWQMATGSPAEALAWMKTLAPAMQTNKPLALLRAEGHIALRDWAGLQEFLKPLAWEGMDPLRYAFLTMALRGQNLETAAKSEWERAMRAAGGRKEALIMLLGRVSKWGWGAEGEEILTTIIKNFPDETWARQVLTETLYLQGRTRSLMTFYSQQAKAFPADLGVKNDLATTALLLNAPEFKPHDLAKEVYEKSPTNAAFASTYAFSLHLQNKNDLALQVLERLPPSALQKPDMAGYYGLVLKAAGQAAKASASLDLALKGRLLPEERKLFEGK